MQTIGPTALMLPNRGIGMGMVSLASGGRLWILLNECLLSCSPNCLGFVGEEKAIAPQLSVLVTFRRLTEIIPLRYLLY
jgi:hypothetical protein